MRHYQRRPRSSSRSGALDQSNGNRGWYSGMRLPAESRVRVHARTCERMRARGRHRVAWLRISRFLGRSRRRNQRLPARPRFRLISARAAEQRWFRDGDNFQSARGNGADAIIFRGEDVGRGEGRGHVPAERRSVPPCPPGSSPPFVTVRSRSPLSGVSDGYEILRAPAAEWGPPEVNYSPGSARIATTASPAPSWLYYNFNRRRAPRRDVTRSRTESRSGANLRGRESTAVIQSFRRGPDSTVIEHVQPFPSGRPHTHTTRSHPRFTADRDGPTKVWPRINIPNVGSDGFMIARGVQVANASFAVRIIGRDIMSRASCFGEQAWRMKRSPRFRADSPKSGLRNRDNPLAVSYRNCITLKKTNHTLPRHLIKFN